MKWHFIWQKRPNIQWAFSREIMVFQLRIRDYNLVIAYGEACTYEHAAERNRVSFGASVQLTPCNPAYSAQVFGDSVPTKKE